jgi:hypothetical protein
MENMFTQITDDECSDSSEEHISTQASIRFAADCNRIAARQPRLTFDILFHLKHLAWHLSDTFSEITILSVGSDSPTRLHNLDQDFIESLYNYHRILFN